MLRILFLGTSGHPVSEACREALRLARHTLVTGLSQSAPKGRGNLRLDCGGRPENLASVNSVKAIARVASFEPDLIVVAGFPEILAPALFEIARLGAINVHPSLLPQFRGPDPLYWVLKERKPSTGITIHYIDRGIDSGDIVLQSRIAIDRLEDESSLLKKVVAQAPRTLLKAVRMIEKGTARRRPQNAADATYYPRRPSEGPSSGRPRAAASRGPRRDRQASRGKR